MRGDKLWQRRGNKLWQGDKLWQNRGNKLWQGDLTLVQINMMEGTKVGKGEQTSAEIRSKMAEILK